MSNASSANETQFVELGLPKNHDSESVEPPLLQNTVDGAAGGSEKPKPARALKRRVSDKEPQGPTIDNVRELLLGDTLKKSQQELQSIERNTSGQLELLREEMGGRIDRVVRALSSVNQAVHKEMSVREDALRQSEEALVARAEALETKMEDRLSFLEAKIYTVVADTERKMAASQAADKDSLVSQLAERELAVDQKIAELTEAVEGKMEAFGQRITSEIGEVSDAVNAARAKAGEEAEALGSQVGQRLGALETQLAAQLQDLRGELGKSTAHLRSELATQAGQQQALLAQVQVDTQSELNAHVEQLEGGKMSRTDFSGLLKELAARLDPDELGDD